MDEIITIVEKTITDDGYILEDVKQWTVNHGALYITFKNGDQAYLTKKHFGDDLYKWTYVTKKEQDDRAFESW